MAGYQMRRDRRPRRASETAPAYGVEPPPFDAPVEPVGFRVAVAGRGRMVLPAEVRERLRIKDGDTVSLILEPTGVVRILTGAVYARSLRGMFKHLVPPGRSLSDELIAERRLEAARDKRESRDFARRYAAMSKRRAKTLK